MSDLRSIIRPADGDDWTLAEGSIDGRRSVLAGMPDNIQRVP
jgi:hypothetical protein